MNVVRAGHTATPLEDVNGNITGILVVGGASGTVGAATALDSAEIYGTPLTFRTFPARTSPA